MGEESAPATEDVLQPEEHEDSVCIELVREDVTYKPGGIHVCQESRNIALKGGYEVLSILIGGKHQNFWYNRKTDTLRLETPETGDALLDCVCERVLSVIWPWTILDSERTLPENYDASLVRVRKVFPDALSLYLVAR